MALGPTLEEQPPRPGSSEPCRKKIACASAPNQGVNFAGLPSGAVTVMEIELASMAFRRGCP